MTKVTALENIGQWMEKLEKHPIYQSIRTVDDMRFFMERHVYAVLDFMSLTKFLQHHFAPSTTMWVPPKHPDMARFMNEIVMCEESDETLSGGYLSHFDMYLEAMKEVGADVNMPLRFIDVMKQSGWKQALELSGVPDSVKPFLRETFLTVESGDVLSVAGSFCFGREKSIPGMFQNIVDSMGVAKEEAPNFYYYLQRHIEVDGGEHGPMAMKMLDILCEDSDSSWDSILVSAINAIKARIALWDAMMEEYSDK